MSDREFLPFLQVLIGSCITNVLLLSSSRRAELVILLSVVGGHLALTLEVLSGGTGALGFRLFHDNLVLRLRHNFLSNL